MHNNVLYFIPLVAKALRQLDARASLRNAFKEIHILGQKPEYGRGLANFKLFMAEVQHNLATKSDREQDVVLLEIMLEESIRFHEFGEINEADLQWRSADSVLDVIVEKNDEQLGAISTAELPVSKSFIDIQPGHYAVKLSTGRILWNGILAKKDLFWTEAYPNQAIKLVADTGATSIQVTRKIRLLDGEVMLHVFPGIESGRIQVRIGYCKR